MITGGSFLDYCVLLSLFLLAIAFVLIVIRIITGPTLPDRVLALDMLVAVGIGFIAAIGVKTQFFLYIDIAIALGLVGFLATVAFARYILVRGTSDEGPPGSSGSPSAEKSNRTGEGR